MERARSISKSMVSYLKRSRDHKEFLLKETHEFDKGRRLLANMMGLDPDEMDQRDIDSAISYLLPSGLFDKKAIPTMKHPELVFKTQKDAQFDVEGRPFHHLFYTVTPNYNEALSIIGDKARELNKIEDDDLARGIVTPPEGSRYEFVGRQWITLEQMADKFIERISDRDHQYFIRVLEKLITHPYSARAAQIFDEYSIELSGQSVQLDLPELKRDEETGQIYTELEERSKEHHIRVKTVLNGSGVFDFQGYDILYFERPYIRRSLFSPIAIAGLQDRVDIYAKLVDPIPPTKGESSIAKCIRRAVSLSIAAYVDPSIREKLRLAGLLTLDTRLPARKMYGQEGARRKFTWKKR